ncbi:hypothetical protein FRC07_011432, partial [Ceratobasidium sp. 392]
MSDHLRSVEIDASVQVLAVPELLRLVCGFLDKKNCAALLCTSRRVFASAMPIVWEDVDLKSVLLLIPGVKVATVIVYSSETRLKIELPATVTLERFEVYSPFVEVVRTAMPYSIRFPNEWPGMGAEASSQPLLPNLRSLVISTFGWVDDSYVDWVPRLLTLGLKELKMCSIPVKSSSTGYEQNENAWINQSKCIELIDVISGTCPLIETLEIFSNEDDREDGESAGYVELCSKVAGLHSLRSLSFGGSNAGQVLFQAFGQLPLLESLRLVTDGSQPMPQDSDPVTLSDDSFPSLRHLTLSGLNPWIIRRVCNTPQLFRRLTSAVISYEDADYDECEGEEVRSGYAIKCFRHNGSCLTDLTIHTRGDGGNFSIFRPFVDFFKRLPLRRLDLGGIVLNPQLNEWAEEEDLEEAGTLETNEPELNWGEFLDAVPDLEELRLHNTLKLPSLAAFAESLTKLRLIALDSIITADTEEASSVANRPAATQPIVIRYDTESYWGFSSDEKAIHNLAKQIYNIWPNAKLEANSASSLAEQSQRTAN